MTHAIRFASKAILAAAISLYLPIADSAVRLESTTVTHALATLSGQITRTDIDELIAILVNKEPNQILVLFLASPGGDWHAAIQLGHLLRSEGGRVVVTERGCSSACVMVLAGATHRVISGPVGVHRPYPSSTENRSYADAQRQFRELDDATRRFLAEMNVPPSLFDLMARIPPERIHILTTQELSQFGLSARDPVAEELENAAEARQLGIPIQEFLARKARRDRICSNGANYPTGLDPREYGRSMVACRTAIMQGRSWPGPSR